MPTEPSLPILLLGDSQVGKTALVSRLVRDHVNPTSLSVYLPTIAVDFNVHATNNIQLMLFDLSGNPKYESIIRAYYSQAVAVILVYDCTRRESFEHVRRWYNKCGTAEERAKRFFLLIATHTDKIADRQVSIEEGWELAREFKAGFREVSCLERSRVQEMFNHIVHAILKVVLRHK
jgi:small GTP-binding protein